MKVYIVTSDYCNEGKNVAAVFLDKVKADNHRDAEAKRITILDFYVEEFEVTE